MKQTEFKTPLQFSFRGINHAVILEKFGYYVEIVLQLGSKRTVFYVDDIPAVHELLDNFDRGESLTCSTKELLDIRTDLFQRVKRLCMTGVL